MVLPLPAGVCQGRQSHRSEPAKFGVNCGNLKPHLSRTFKLSRDTKFLEKLPDEVGLYLNPPHKRWCCVWMKRAKFRR